MNLINKRNITRNKDGTTGIGPVAPDHPKFKEYESHLRSRDEGFKAGQKSNQNNNKAYVGKGSFGVSSILDNQLSSIVDGYVIIEKGKKSDVFTLYLETELYDEYYFHYNNGVMQGYSTNPKFMAAINDVKEKKRVAENKKGASVYRYTFASEDVTDKFLKYVKKKY